MSEQLSKLLSKVNQTKTVIIFINQVRSTIEYIPVTDKSIASLANDLAQKSWRYAHDLKPKEGVETLEEYRKQLIESGYY